MLDIENNKISNINVNILENFHIENCQQSTMIYSFTTFALEKYQKHRN